MYEIVTVPPAAECRCADITFLHLQCTQLQDALNKTNVFVDIHFKDPKCVFVFF